MRTRRCRHARFQYLLAILLLMGIVSGADGASADPSGRKTGGISSSVPAATGRIRIEGVRVRPGQWVSVGETGFHPDQTLVPGSPPAKSKPAAPETEPQRNAEPSSGMITPPLPETSLNRIDYPVRLSEAGMLGGFGFGKIPEGSYEPILMAAHFGLDINRFLGIPGTHRGRFTVFAEPRFTPVHEPAGDYELGLGIGIQYVYPLLRNLFFYAAVSSGPHFISVRTEQQARGFVMDSEAGGGFYVPFSRNSALNIGYRIRHLSNGGTRTPNTGINNHFLVIGYTVFLGAPEEKERNE